MFDRPSHLPSCPGDVFQRRSFHCSYQSFSRPRGCPRISACAASGGSTRLTAPDTTAFDVEKRDSSPDRKSPPILGLSANPGGSFSGAATGWLGREDSNHDILSLQTPFEMSGEFRPISWKCRAGDFRNYLSRIWERQRPDKLLACFGPVSGRPDVSREVGQGPYANVRFGSPCLRAGLES
jgi:hypothetical protein